jgi:hypothetical protein
MAPDQQQPLSVEDAWQRRQRCRQEQREAAFQQDLYRAGHLTASARAALAQRQNRLEHSR